MGEVMRLVRDALGDEAIIVSSLEDEDGTVRVTAALERAEPEFDGIDPEGIAAAAAVKALRQTLDYHGVPAETAERLLRAAGTVDAKDPVLAFAAALDEQYRFAPIPNRSIARPIMLVGPHGAGKTLTTAKLAARLVMQGLPVDVISVDTERAAATAQLAAFTDILGIDLANVADPEALTRRLGDCVSGGAIFIDSAGVNPFVEAELRRIGDLAEAAGAETVLVLAAGIDPIEAGEIADAFRVLSPSRLVTTRIDAARRLGGMLAAADLGGLSFADAGVAPSVAHGLGALNPISLSRLLNRDPRRLDGNLEHEEAAE